MFKAVLITEKSHQVWLTFSILLLTSSIISSYYKHKKIQNKDNTVMDSTASETKPDGKLTRTKRGMMKSDMWMRWSRLVRAGRETDRWPQTNETSLIHLGSKPLTNSHCFNLWLAACEYTESVWEWTSNNWPIRVCSVLGTSE